jgi:hypothetical protein
MGRDKGNDVDVIFCLLFWLIHVLRDTGTIAI